MISRPRRYKKHVFFSLFIPLLRTQGTPIWRCKKRGKRRVYIVRWRVPTKGCDCFLLPALKRERRDDFLLPPQLAVLLGMIESPCLVVRSRSQAPGNMRGKKANLRQRHKRKRVAKTNVGLRPGLGGDEKITVEFLSAE